MFNTIAYTVKKFRDSRDLVLYPRTREQNQEWNNFVCSSYCLEKSIIVTVDKVFHITKTILPSLSTITNIFFCAYVVIEP